MTREVLFVQEAGYCQAELVTSKKICLIVTQKISPSGANKSQFIGQSRTGNRFSWLHVISRGCMHSGMHLNDWYRHLEATTGLQWLAGVL